MGNIILEMASGFELDKIFIATAITHTIANASLLVWPG